MAVLVFASRQVGAIWMSNVIEQISPRNNFKQIISIKNQM